MPHITVEYTDNIPNFNAPSALVELNRVLAASKQFEDVDIKSRAIRFDTHLIGTTPGARAFVHVKVAILSGRSMEKKRELSEGLLASLKQLCQWPAGVHVQLCVEIQDIERESYAKTSGLLHFSTSMN